MAYLFEEAMASWPDKSAMAIGLEKNRVSPYCERINIRNHQNQQCIAEKLGTIAQINIVRICIVRGLKIEFKKIKFI